MLGSLKVCTSNFISSYESLKSFRKFYPDSSLVLLSNIKEYDLYNIELSKIYNGDCILYKKSLDYPSYPISDKLAMDKLIEHIENILKASLFIKDKYFLYQEPDYFMLDKVDISNYDEDFITNFHFVPRLFDFSMTWIEDKNQQINFLKELTESGIFNKFMDKYPTNVFNSFIYTYGPGNIIKTDFSRKLYFNFDKIKIFLMEYDELVRKHFTKYNYNLDFILSLISTLFFATVAHYEHLLFYYQIEKNDFYDLDLIRNYLRKCVNNEVERNKLKDFTFNSIHGIKLLYNHQLSRHE